MKKLGAFLVGLGLAAGTVLASNTNTASSVNAVGFQNVTVPTGYSLMSVPFNAVGGATPTIDNIFSTNVPDSTVLYFYEPISGYYSITYISGLGWVDDSFNPAGTNVLGLGKAFWIQSTSNIVVTTSGEVPGGSVPTNSINIVPGYQLFGYSYPASTSVTNAVGLVPMDSDVIYSYTPGVGYVSLTYINGLGWVDDAFSPSDMQISMGQGYWYQSSGSHTWNQVKPYQWP